MTNHKYREVAALLSGAGTLLYTRDNEKAKEFNQI